MITLLDALGDLFSRILRILGRRPRHPSPPAAGLFTARQRPAARAASPTDAFDPLFGPRPQEPAPGDAPGTASAGSQVIAPRTPPASDGPSRIRVHDDRLERRSGPIMLTPSEALALARDGRDALQRHRRR